MTIRAATAILLLGWALTGCGGESVPSPVTPTVEATTPTRSPSEASSPSSSTTPQSWTMPDLRGKNLQDAEDAIQDLTGDPFRDADSKDLTGQDRHQFLDRDWQVCTSTPAPGETFDADTEIVFGVVRIDAETCPQ